MYLRDNVICLYFYTIFFNKMLLDSNPQSLQKFQLLVYCNHLYLVMSDWLAWLYFVFYLGPFQTVDGGSAFFNFADFRLM